MTKREAIAWLAKHHACGAAMRRISKRASVKQMIEKATEDDLSWAMCFMGDRVWTQYNGAVSAAAVAANFGTVAGRRNFQRERVAAKRRILIAWASSK